MLYLESPFHIIEGVSVFTDHADPLQFYYMPLMPHLTEVEDPVAGVNIPQIQLIKYRGAAGGGGFLNFDVNLGVDEEKLDDIRRELRNLHQLDVMPRLAPVPLSGGTVKLMLFGSESGGEEPDPNADGPQFVLKMNHHAHPALYGDNQASFSVELDEAGVTTVEKAMQGEMSPIGVVYSLDYTGLRPAYSVRVKADWDRVQKHIQESTGADFIVFSTQVDKIVDELIEEQAIVIEIDSFIPPGEDASSLLGRLDQAVNEVKDMVLENFFEPSLDPIREEEDGWDKALHAAERIALLHATGGWSGIGGFTHKNVDITRIDQKRLNVNMTERAAVTRSIYPQAHLKGLFRVLRDSNGTVDLDRFVIPVDLDDPWFQERRVRVMARTNFAADNIDSVNVRLNYNGEPKNVILDAATPQATVRWDSVLDNGAVKRDVTATYEVSFKSVEGAERPVSLSSGEEVIDVENFEVRPHELYTLIPVSIVALDFPWEAYPHVEVQVRYEDPGSGISAAETFVLNSDVQSAVWDLFMLDPDRNTFEYRLIYRAADHRDVEMPWLTTGSEQVTIRDPFPRKRRLQIVPAFNWNEVSTVFVDVNYVDEKNNVREDHSVSFTPDDKGFKTVELRRLADPEHRFLTYRTSVIYNDGRVLETPPSMTLADRAIVTGQMRGHQIVSVHPEAVPFSNSNIREIEVILRFEDADAGLSFSDSFRFRSHEDRPRYFEYDFADPQRKGYEFQLVFYHQNGMQRTTDWETVDEAELVITTD